MIKSHTWETGIQWVLYKCFKEAVGPKGIASGGSPSLAGEFFCMCSLSLQSSIPLHDKIKHQNVRFAGMKKRRDSISCKICTSKVQNRNALLSFLLKNYRI